MTLHITLDTARVIATPAATMRTLASPTTTPAMPVAVWRTEMEAGSVGPEHVIDSDQLVVVIAGSLDVRVDGTSHRVGEGEGIKLPGGASRVIAPAESGPAATITVGQAGARALVAGHDAVVIPWTA